MLKIESWPVTKPIPYARNPRKISQQAISAVAGSIKEFGFKSPIIVDVDGVIINGHTRLKAAQSLGMESVPVVVASDLTPAQVQAYRLADNRVAEFSEWDADLLKIELGECTLEMDFAGFDALLAELPEPEPETMDEGDPDAVPEEAQGESASQRGEMYELGPHRLMCGDSTSTEDVSILMGGDRADMVFTDPPYNINYQGVAGNHEKIENDKMSDSDFVAFLQAAIPLAEVMYVCHSWQYSHLFRSALENNGVKLKALIVWDKVNPAQHLDLYFKQHELIWYTGPFGGRPTVRGIYG